MKSAKKNLAEKVWDYFYTPDNPPMKTLTYQEYYELFGGTDTLNNSMSKAYEQAWQAKNFEIDNYWKRANYFWLFQAAAFTGYFAVLGTDAYKIKPQSAYMVACIGFLTALALHFTNQGSKIWQRHWEIHVDMLEEKVTGPLYKIVTAPKTYSVSKINEIISNFICFIWGMILILYVLTHCTYKYSGISSVELEVWVSSILTVYFGASMQWGYGRGRFGKREVKFYHRDFTLSPDEVKSPST